MLAFLQMVRNEYVNFAFGWILPLTIIYAVRDYETGDKSRRTGLETRKCIEN